MRKDICVIGGGYTGLTAALRLAELGHKVTVLEKGSFVGGLASGFIVEGEHLEKAYHHIFKTDVSIINLAKELGVGSKLVWKDSSLSLYYDNQLYPFMTPIDLLKFKALSLPNRVRAGLVILYLQKTKKWQDFQNISAYNWMLRHSGKQVTKVIWEPLLRGKFDKHYNKVSMAWLWARIHIRANSREKGESSEKLGYFLGGFDVFTTALVKKLDELGVKIKINVDIDSIDSTKEQRIVRLANKKELSFDAILSTTPSSVFAHLIRNNQVKKSYLKQLNSIDYLGAVLYIFSSTQEISPYYWHNINDISMPFLVFINHTRLIDKKKYNGNYIYYIGAYLPHDHKYFTSSDKDIEKAWEESLRDVFPGFDTNKIREKHIFKFKNAQHIVTLDYAKKIPSYKTPLRGVFLANFSQIYPEDRGTNYAVAEGEKIAKITEEYLTSRS